MILSVPLPNLVTPVVEDEELIVLVEQLLNHPSLYWHHVDTPIHMHRMACTCGHRCTLELLDKVDHWPNYLEG